MRARLEPGDRYLSGVTQKWQDGIVKLVNEMPPPEFRPAGSSEAGFATAA
jgi:hypothetical protein